MWLTPDDSPQITNQSIAAQKAHFDEMVRRFDNQVTAYVACLECDEYWSPAMVNELVRHLKTKTNKPVAVHMTSGVGGHKGNLAYYKGADYVFLQTGWNKSHAEIQAMVKDAMAKTGLPVVLSEYAQESRSGSARAMGDAGCAAGAVGTGNGRSITFCGQEPQPIAEPKDKNNNYAYIAAAIVAVGVFAYIGYNYDITFNFNVTDEMSMFEVQKKFQLTDQSDIRFSWQNMEQGKEDQQRLMLSYNFRW
jgi:predicted metal-binding protein